MTKKIETFLVGGAVRDLLLAQIHGVDAPKVADLDYVVVNGSPSIMLELGYENVGNEFPVFLHPETKDEYALARKERKNDGVGYTAFDTDWEGVTLEEDLYRRDLTINAMAQDEDGNVVDIFNGQEDLKNKVIRHVSEAFKEDPVRILRVARFATKLPNFTIAEETMSLMQEMVKDGMVNDLTAERVWKEWYRAMEAKEPQRFFEVLRDTGALEVLFPVLHKMQSIPQRADYHAEGDVFTHTMMVLKEAAELTKDMPEERRQIIRMGALLHDVGKTKTKHELLYHETGEIRGSHTGHDDLKQVKPLIMELKEKYKMPDQTARFCLDVAVFHQRFHAAKSIKKHMGWLKMFEELKIKQKSDGFGEEYYFENLMLTCQADARGRLITVDGKVFPASRDYPQAEIIKEKLDLHKQSTIFLGQFFSFAKEHSLNIKPQEAKQAFMLLCMEGNSYEDALSLSLNKENRNILRSKNIDIPFSKKELKSIEKRKSIEARKEAKRNKLS